MGVYEFKLNLDFGQQIYLGKLSLCTWEANLGNTNLEPKSLTENITHRVFRARRFYLLLCMEGDIQL